MLCGDTLDGNEAVAAGLAWRCLPDDDLLPFAHRLAVRAAGRPRALVARTKATLDALAGVTTSDEAVEIELAAQQWSIEQPAFAEALARVRAADQGLSTGTACVNGAPARATGVDGSRWTYPRAPARPGARTRRGTSRSVNVAQSSCSGPTALRYQANAPTSAKR